MRSLLLAAALLGATVPPHGAADRTAITKNGPHSAVLPLRVLLDPLLPRPERRPLENAVSIERHSRATVIGLPLLDHGRGVVLEVSGSIEIGRVEVVFDDGELERFDLAPRHVYRDGRYTLTTFDNERTVALVRLMARARSGHAAIRALLVRDET